MHRTTRLVVKSKNKVAIIILIFVVVNFGFLVVALDVGLNPIHEGKMADTKGIMLGHIIPFSPGNFLATHNGAHPKMRQQIPEVEERWLLQEWQTGLW
jgi:hypothetical protein